MQTQDNFDNSMEITNNNHISIAWIGLKYCVKTEFTRKTKTILNDINGSIDFGTITAIMGPSGAGKTTLLKCISGRETKGIDRKTKMFVNKVIEIKCCFIVQEVKEHLLNGLTTLQSIVYSSKLKNRRKGFNHELNARNILMSLNIANTANTCVDECSGGEQKRIAIALELTAEDKPNLLCIDEPTSGLDSCAAEEIILCLKELSVNNGISVVTSIHQPNHEIISQFDKLYVMCVGGQCVYDGTPNNLSAQMQRFGSFLEWVSNDNNESIELLIKMCSRNDSQENQRMIEFIKTNVNSLEERCLRECVISDLSFKKKESFSLSQMWYLMVRSFVHNFRCRLRIDIITFIFFCSIAFIICKICDEDVGLPTRCIDPHNPPLCNETEQDLKDDNLIDENDGLFFYAIALLFMLIMITAAMIIDEKSIFNNEKMNGKTF